MRSLDRLSRRWRADFGRASSVQALPTRQHGGHEPTATEMRFAAGARDPACGIAGRATEGAALLSCALADRPVAWGADRWLRAPEVDGRQPSMFLRGGLERYAWTGATRRAQDPTLDRATGGQSAEGGGAGWASAAAYEPTAPSTPAPRAVRAQPEPER